MSAPARALPRRQWSCSRRRHLPQGGGGGATTFFAACRMVVGAFVIPPTARSARPTGRGADRPREAAGVPRLSRSQPVSPRRRGGVLGGARRQLAASAVGLHDSVAGGLAASVSSPTRRPPRWAARLAFTSGADGSMFVTRWAAAAAACRADDAGARAAAVSDASTRAPRRTAPRRSTSARGGRRRAGADSDEGLVEEPTVTEAARVGGVGAIESAARDALRQGGGGAHELMTLIGANELLPTTTSRS